MAGQVLGSSFKFVIGSLFGGELLLPDLCARVEQLRDDEWVPWDEYVEATRRIAELLDDATVVAIGEQIMLAARAHLEEQGFDSPGGLLSDWRRVFTANVRHLDEASLPRTLEAGEARAVIDYGTDLPPALVEGYLRGAVLMFDGRVERFTRERVTVDGTARLRCRIEWS